MKKLRIDESAWLRIRTYTLNIQVLLTVRQIGDWD